MYTLIMLFVLLFSEPFSEVIFDNTKKSYCLSHVCVGVSFDKMCKGENRDSPSLFSAGNKIGTLIGEK